jgi:hypothetical protein
MIEIYIGDTGSRAMVQAPFSVATVLATEEPNTTMNDAWQSPSS